MRRLVVAVLAALVVGGFIWCAHPVCVPLSAEESAAAAHWRPPIQERRDRQLHGRVWQRRGGRWFQCKSWISREMFF